MSSPERSGDEKNGGKTNQDSHATKKPSFFSMAASDQQKRDQTPGQYERPQVEDPRQARKCDRCIEAWHNRAASYSAGFHMWCSHSRALVEPEKKKGCEWFIDRSELIIV